MLNNFNNLIKSILLEQVEEDKDEEKEKIMASYNTNEFYTRVLEPITDGLNVVLTKQRNNTYLVYGPVGDLIKFFNGIKVDKEFMDDPKEFKIYSPIFTYGDYMGKLKLDQFYPITNFEKTGVPFTHELENIDGNVLEGKWYSIFENDVPDGKFIKGVAPSDMEKKVFKKMFPKGDKSFTENFVMYVEFQVNTEGLKNLIWDEMTEYAKDPDEMNDLHNSDPDDFDYTQLNVKNENDEATVKAALKDIKRSSKEFKENKIK